MKQETIDKIKIKKAYQIDKQFFVCLDDIFKRYSEQLIYDIAVSCGQSKYTFDSLNEFLNYSDKFIEKIESFQLKVYFTNSKYKYGANNIYIEFNNKPSFFSRGEICFYFNNESYLVMKNNIQTLLKNQKVSYSFFTKIPIITCLDILLFIGLCVYAYAKNISFSVSILQSILYICILIALASAFPPCTKLKRYLFPLNEIRFGVNIDAYSKAKNLRNLFGVTIILTFIVGIFVNIVSNFIL
ncbi:hypothetical protein [Sellimonas intestinalis]|uniref:hypothetical protein n=1 Tax=Sellimonas intestinalis TaxID=1653434 RepID=UPI00189ABA1D|nr:hypothetical protein [Sellimonas intestinalis]